MNAQIAQSQEDRGRRSTRRPGLASSRRGGRPVPTGGRRRVRLLDVGRELLLERARSVVHRVAHASPQTSVRRPGRRTACLPSMARRSCGRPLRATAPGHMGASVPNRTEYQSRARRAGSSVGPTGPTAGQAWGPPVRVRCDLVDRPGRRSPNDAHLVVQAAFVRWPRSRPRCVPLAFGGAGCQLTPRVGSSLDEIRDALAPFPKPHPDRQGLATTLELVAPSHRSPDRDARTAPRPPATAASGADASP